MYWSPYNNFGDKLAPVLVEKITGIKPKRIAPKGDKRWILGAGSIIQSYRLDNCTIWGTGAIREDAVIIGRPREIRAVRGPLTRDILLKYDIRCPEKYGDPGLLTPRFFRKSPTRYYVGLCPHRVDSLHPWVHEKASKVKKSVIIDMTWPIEKTIAVLSACEYVLSSSLHGLIVAHAYGIPALWVEFSDKVIGKGFKFRDYQLSVGQPITPTVRITKDVKLSSCIESCSIYPMGIDLNELQASCPRE